MHVNGKGMQRWSHISSLSRGVWGHAPPKVLNNRCSEVHSDAFCGIFKAQEKMHVNLMYCDPKHAHTIITSITNTPKKREKCRLSHAIQREV